MVLLLALASLAAGGATGQDEAPPEDAAGGPSLAAVEGEREALAAEVAAASDPDRRSRLEKIDRTLGQQIEALRRGEEIEAGTMEGEDPLAGLGEPPYSITALDTISAGRAEQAERTRALDDNRESAAQANAEARTRHEESEADRRRVKDAVASASESERPDLEAKLAKRELESRTSQARLTLRRLQLRNAERELETQREREQSWNTALARVTEGLRVNQEDLREVFATLEKRARDLDRSMETAKIDLATAERRFAAAQKRADELPSPTPLLREEIAARRAEVAARHRQLVIYEERRTEVDSTRALWERRLEILAGDQRRSVLLDWEDELEGEIHEREAQTQATATRLGELLAELSKARERLAGLAPGDPTRPWIEGYERAVRTQVELAEAELHRLGEGLALRRRVLGDLGARTSVVDLADRLQALRERAGELWTYELTSSEDRPVTVGKIATGLLVFTIGLALVKLIVWGAGRFVFPRVRLEEGAAHAFESLGFYALLVLVFLVALRSVDIPLTAFAVAGGALAIGIGFGSQNVMNNFISGLILLVERPIKLGDLIELQGIYGTVNRIGLRSTSVRTGDNIHLIVPNSAFLESQVVNWTHNNPNVRVSVTVGVVYGSPTRQVEEIVRRVLVEHPNVRPEPEPIILFTGFGDNSLDFEARFWIRMKNIMDRLRVESDVRFRIDDLFREAGIVIAFPQRDVHLDTATPLEVRMVDGREEGSDKPTPTAQTS